MEGGLWLGNREETNQKSIKLNYYETLIISRALVGSMSARSCQASPRSQDSRPVNPRTAAIGIFPVACQMHTKFCYVSVDDFL